MTIMFSVMSVIYCQNNSIHYQLICLLQRHQKILILMFHIRIKTLSFLQLHHFRNTLSTRPHLSNFYFYSCFYFSSFVFFFCLLLSCFYVFNFNWLIIFLVFCLFLIFPLMWCSSSYCPLCFINRLICFIIFKIKSMNSLVYKMSKT